MKSKFARAFMEVAETFANLSTAKRAKVGAIIVKDNRIISIGYNGMPSGWTNECETYTGSFPERDGVPQDSSMYKTKPEVLHAETNAIAKVARSPESAEGAALFCTHMPCMDCAKLIYQSGIKHVYYKIAYEAAMGSGKEFLEKSGLTVTQLTGE
jgi:dCMP deaminase